MQGFVTEGSPRTTGDKLASYEAWDSRVRQAVIWIGSQRLMPEGASVADPVDAMERAKKDEPERQKLGALLRLVWQWMYDPKRHVSGEPKLKWQVADLVKVSDMAVACPDTCPQAIADLRGVLEEIAGEHGKINRRILGRWLEKQADRRCEGMWIERAGQRSNIARWTIKGEPTQEPDEDE